MDIKELLEYAPMLVALLLFFAFLKNNNKYKKIKAGPLELEANDHHAHGSGHHISAEEKKEAQDKAHKEIVAANKAIRADIKRLSRKIDCSIDKLGTKIEGIAIYVDKLETTQLKTLFYSASQPLAERLLAGLRYLHKGENGEIGRDVVKMAMERIEMYDALCAVQPEYKVADVEKNKRRRGNEKHKK